MNNLVLALLVAALLNGLILFRIIGPSPLLLPHGRLATAGILGLWSGTLMVGVTSVHGFAVLRLDTVNQVVPGLALLLGLTAVFGSLLASPVKKLYPDPVSSRYLFLALVMSNGLVPGAVLSLTDHQTSLMTTLNVTLAGATGFILVLLAYIALLERVQLAKVPGLLRGLPVEVLCALLSFMALSGFARVL